MAVQHGVPIFVEKPPAISLTALQQMAAAALSADVLTGVGMNFRFATACQEVKTILDSGEYGTPIALTIHHMASKPRAPLWGLPLVDSVLLSQVIHPVDLTLHLMGDVSFLHTIGRMQGDTCMLGLQLQFMSGAIGTIVCGTAARRFRCYMEIVTDTGVTIACDNLWKVSIRGGGGDETGVAWDRSWSPGALDRGYSRAGYQGELRQFIDAVRTSTQFSPSLSDLLPVYDVLNSVGKDLASC